MSLSKALAMGPLVLAWRCAAFRARAQAPADPGKRDDAPIVKLSERLRAPGSTGKWKEVGVDAGKSRISAVPRLRLDERAVPTRASAGIDGQPAATWTGAACRERSASASATWRSAGTRSPGRRRWRWRICGRGWWSCAGPSCPAGAPPRSVVYQQRETELALLKCIRGRMEAWQFTPASGDPIVIEQTYDFQAALTARRPRRHRRPRRPDAEPSAKANDRAPAPRSGRIRPMVEGVLAVLVLGLVVGLAWLAPLPLLAIGAGLASAGLSASLAVGVLYHRRLRLELMRRRPLPAGLVVGAVPPAPGAGRARAGGGAALLPRRACSWSSWPSPASAWWPWAWSKAWLLSR